MGLYNSLGQLVVPHALTVFRLYQDNNTVAETQVTLEGRLIPLKDNITHKHSSMGILRCAQIAEIEKHS